MSRPLRIHYPNATYHVMNRGANRQKIFKNDTHRIIFLDLLEESSKMFNIKIYAYCLMDNHYHLLLSTPDGNLSRVMRHINGVYTQKFNRLSKLDGPLFRGRYRAQLIDDDCYQLIASRYIHLNPVEARIVRNPADYKWSSYSAYLGLTKAPEWLLVDIIKNQLAATQSLSYVQNYQDYVENKDISEINVFTGSKFTAPIIAPVAFKDKILSTIDPTTSIECSSDIKRAKNIPKIELIMNIVCLFYNINREQLASSKTGMSNWPKTAFIYICRKEYGLTLRSIVLFAGLRRPESASTAALRCQSLLLKDPALQDEIKCIVKRINEAGLQPTTADISMA